MVVCFNYWNIFCEICVVGIFLYCLVIDDEDGGLIFFLMFIFFLIRDFVFCLMFFILDYDKEFLISFNILFCILD